MFETAKDKLAETLGHDEVQLRAILQYVCLFSAVFIILYGLICCRITYSA